MYILSLSYETQQKVLCKLVRTPHGTSGGDFATEIVPLVELNEGNNN